MTEALPPCTDLYLGVQCLGLLLEIRYHVLEPEMALSIVLSGRQPPYYSSGDIICGTVQLSTSAPCEPCESLSIIFVGQAQVFLTHHDADMVSALRARHSSRAFLIRKSVLLESRANFNGLGTSYWPFSFLVPSHVDFDLGHDIASWGDLFEWHTPWKGSIDADAHPLPPSMSYDSSFRCSVSYVLIARLIRQPGAILHGIHDLTATCAIRICHHREGLDGIVTQNSSASQSIESDILLTHSRVADKLGQCARRMTRLRAHSSGSQSMASTGRLKLRVILPSVIEQHDPRPLPVGFSFCYIGSDPIEANQQVSVINFTVKLLAITSVRVGMRRQEQRSVMQLYSGGFNQSLEVAASEDSPSGDGFDCLDIHMGTLLRSALGKYDLVPEFSTYNIHRAYTLEIRMKIRVLGQNFTFRRENIAVQFPGIRKAEFVGGVPPYSVIVNNVTGTLSVSADSYSPREDCGTSPPAYSP